MIVISLEDHPIERDQTIILPDAEIGQSEPLPEDFDFLAKECRYNNWNIAGSAGHSIPESFSNFAPNQDSYPLFYPHA